MRVWKETGKLSEEKKRPGMEKLDIQGSFRKSDMTRSRWFYLFQNNVSLIRMRKNYFRRLTFYF